MNHHYGSGSPVQHGIGAFGRPEFNAGGVFEAGMAVTPPKYRLFALFAAACFGAGVVAGIMLEQGSPEYPPSPNICRADEVGHRTDCVPASSVAPVPAGEGVAR
ncbi:hypothetical protein ACIBQ0_17615 [Nocardia nova]|uniref:hypothetical protein n=1 Tax=Nocardia nova TaxID=37330 RepID=UPI00378AD912